MRIWLVFAAVGMLVLIGCGSNPNPRLVNIRATVEALQTGSQPSEALKPSQQTIPTPIVIVKEVVVEKIVVKEVPVDVVKEVIKEVEVEVIKEVIKECTCAEEMADSVLPGIDEMLGKPPSIPDSIKSFLPKPSSTVTKPPPTYLNVGESHVAEDGLTLVVTSLNKTTSGNVTSVNLQYTLTNNTADLINEGTFKLYMVSGGGLPQYGSFGQLIPDQTITRSYTFNVQAPELPLLIAYPSGFFDASWTDRHLTWKVD